jgi:hypothetical protein
MLGGVGTLTCGATSSDCGTMPTGGQRCGGAGEGCCFGPGGGGAVGFCTASGLGCVDLGGGAPTCVACGGAGEPCCDGNLCSGGGCCDHSSHLCVASGSACGGNQGNCTSGGCMGGACGRIGQACCGGQVRCTAPFSDCNNGQCQACGGLNQPCCPARNGGGDFCGAPFVCDGGSGMCVHCGGSMERCCPGGVCATGACNNGRCP